VLLMPVLWSLGSAVVSAVSTGQVLVISVGRTQVTRYVVPWQQGWARFAGPVFISAALVLYLARDGRKTSSWWIATGLAFLGLCLLLFSAWLASVQSAGAFALLGGFIAVSFGIDDRLGRWAAFTFMLACVLGLALFIAAK
jgi:hypothetical protein